MAYVGIARPFYERIHNNLEVLNEVLILLNSYFMLIYSDFVGVVEARYQMGHVNIYIVVALVSVNLGIITSIQGRAAYTSQSVEQPGSTCSVLENAVTLGRTRMLL